MGITILNVNRCQLPEGKEAEQESAILAVSMLKFWVDHHPEDFNESMRSQLSNYVKTAIEAETSAVQFRQLSASLTRLVNLYWY